MCGIAGALVFDAPNFSVTPHYLSAMRDTMVHRGPDGAGLWISADAHVGLAHRRLSIIDVSTAANQPMSNEDGSVRLVFNGEIYNHAEIRRELLALGGHIWRTDHSDTEVIVHAFEQWGIDCIHRFRGMFAFALWDARSRELWLVRDRIGIKPLCYSVHHGRITFASEIKALLTDPDQPRRVNHEALYHYLTFMTTPAPQTLFDTIRKLPPGTWLRVREDGSITEKKYWDVWDHTTPLTGVPEQEIAERVLAELRTAVKYRKVSDVPVGVFLSGGIDSSTNTALFTEGESSPVKTFSIGYDGEYQSYQNELHHARVVAERFGTEHHERKLTLDDVIDFLPRMVQLQDEPLADPVCVPVYYVSKLARDNGVVVCQVGEGADELFWGYPTWKLKLRLQHTDNLPVPRLFKHGALAGLRAAGKEFGHPYEALRRSVNGQPVFWSGADAFTDGQKRRLLSAQLRKELFSLTSWEPLRPIWERFQSSASDTSPLNWMSYVDLNVRLPELLLMRVDKMSMGVSLEGRVPFLDHKFVEFAMSIPASLKTKNGELKHVLKRAVRGVIPDAIIDRPKQGFGVPVYEYFFDKLGSYARRELTSFCNETDLFNRTEVGRLIDTGQGSAVWNLLNLAMWWRLYIANDPLSSALNGDLAVAHAG
jgi:asparagine synthase (glutamine-hydrolysing)